MTAPATTSGVASFNPRDLALVHNPCPAQQAGIKMFPELEVDATGQVNTKSFVQCLRNRGFSFAVCALLERGLRSGAEANGKSGDWFNGDDVRKTFIYDDLTTGISRYGYNPTRMQELVAVASGSEIGAAELARIVRTVRAEQKPSLRGVLFTAAEHSLLRYALMGNHHKVPVDRWQAFFERGQMTTHFEDKHTTKGLPGIIWSTTKTLFFIAVQSAMHGTSDLPKLTPLDVGAQAAVAPPARHCPHHPAK